MKKIIICCIALSLSACASFEQNKAEIKLLKDVHKAERQIKKGGINIALGTALVIKGTKEVEKGKKELKQAQDKLAAAVGIRATSHQE